MTEEDPDLLAGDNLDKLRDRNPYPALSERYRLTEELENAKKIFEKIESSKQLTRAKNVKLLEEQEKNKLTLKEKCRELEKERDQAQRMACWQYAKRFADGDPDAENKLAQKFALINGFKCFEEKNS